MSAKATGRSAPTVRTKPVEPLLTTRAEAAKLLAMSLDSFERWVQPELKLVRVASMVLVPLAELRRWTEENAARTLEPAA